MFQIFLRVNFVFITWLIVACLTYWGISNVSMPYDQFQAQHGSFRSFRRYLGPFFLLGIHLSIWFFVFRKNDSGTKIAAFLEALAILVVTVFIPLLRADVFGKEIVSTFVYGGIYASMSYLAYALFYKMDGAVATISSK